MPLIEYAQRKENQIILRTLTYKYTYLFILLFSLIQILGFTLLRALARIKCACRAHAGDRWRRSSRCSADTPDSLVYTGHVW
jgi:hypothetical protein